MELLVRKVHGKDTFALHLANKYGYKILHVADPMKEACKPLFLFDNEQLYGSKKEEIDKRWGVSPREVLQRIGTDMFRKQMNQVIPGIEDTFWLKRLEIELTDLLSDGCDIIIADIRYPNEIDLVKKYGGCMIKVTRSTLESKSDNHISENALNNAKFDITIDNSSSIQELHDKIDEIYPTITNSDNFI